MHTAYQNRTKCTNKLLKQKWDGTYYDEHQEKVKSATRVIDNDPPQTYMHLHLKLKKMQLEEERLATVERDNRILLEKMSYIMRTKARVDNHNLYEHKSLHTTKRQRELLRVTHENQEILKRITAKRPIYSHVQDADDWQRNRDLMENIAKYPKDWYTRVRSHKKKEQRSEQVTPVVTPKADDEKPPSRRSSAASSQPERAESRVSLPAIE